MDPRQYEELVAEYYRSKGYDATLTPYSGDCGIDLFAIKGAERIAVQAKMYGSSRKINRQCVMELHGAKDYFDCTSAVIVTNGKLLSDAIEVAEKLKIKVVQLEASSPVKDIQTTNSYTFESIYKKYIMPLEGQVLVRTNGESNTILKANWSGIERVTSKGNKGKISIEIIKKSINHLLQHGQITRDHINQNFVGRASSGIILVLSQVPFFHETEKPAGLLFKEAKQS